MMSSRFDTPFSATFSSELGLISLALFDIFLDHFYVWVYCMVVIWRSPFFAFVLFEEPALVIIFINWCAFEIRFQLGTSKNVI